MGIEKEDFNKDMLISRSRSDMEDEAILSSSTNEREQSIYRDDHYKEIVDKRWREESIRTAIDQLTSSLEKLEESADAKGDWYGGRLPYKERCEIELEVIEQAIKKAEGDL